MACERFRDALSDAAAGVPALPALEAHLTACEACRAELETLRRVLAAADAELGGLLSAAPSPDFAARIRAAVSEAPSAPAWRPGFWLTLAGAAAAMLVVVGLFALRGEPSRSRAASTLAERAAAAVEKPPAPEPPQMPEARSPTPEPAVARSREGASRSRLAPSRPSVQEPEVLVPPDQAEALLRFAAGLRQRTVAPGSLLVADLNAPLPAESDVHIRPIEIVPLGPEEDTGAE
jgi:hypothetical protein